MESEREARSYGGGVGFCTPRPSPPRASRFALVPSSLAALSPRSTIEEKHEKIDGCKQSPNTSTFVKKYSAARRIFNYILGVWKCDETLSRVFDMLHNNGQIALHEQFQPRLRTIQSDLVPGVFAPCCTSWIKRATPVFDCF